MNSTIPRKRLSARPQAEAYFRRAIPSQYGIRKLPSLIDTSDFKSLGLSNNRIILLCRESTKKQAGGLEHQERIYRDQIKSMGWELVHVESFVCSGKDSYPASRASFLARKFKASVVVESVSRLIRHECWSPKTAERGFQPNVLDMERLILNLGDVPAFTLIDPDSAADQERAAERKRRRIAKPFKSGPSKSAPVRKRAKTNRGKVTDQELLLIGSMLDEGHKPYQIWKRLGIPRSTVYDIVKREFPD